MNLSSCVLARWTWVIIVVLGAGATGSRAADEPLSALHQAAGRGDMAALTQLLTQNHRADEQDAAGETALVHALRGGHLEAARLLLESSASADGRTTDDDRFISPLAIAIERGDVTAVQLLVDHGAGVRWVGRRDLDVFTDHGPWSDLDRLGTYEHDPPQFRFGELELAIDAAGKRGAKEIVAVLLSYRAMVRLQAPPAADADPLVQAAWRGDTAALKRLMNEAENQRRPATTFVRAYQLTLQQGHIEAAALLGPPVRERVYQQYSSQAAAPESVLEAVKSKDYRRVVAALLRGGDPDQGETVSYLRDHSALHWAVSNGDVEIVELLLRHGADPLLRRVDGRTPIDLTSDPKMLSILKAAVAAKTGAASDSPHQPGKP